MKTTLKFFSICATFAAAWLTSFHNAWAAEESASYTMKQASREVLNVRDFGAVGDGKTDDTAALQRALAAAVEMGGNTVLIPAGTFVITEQLAIGDNCTLEGLGGGSVIKSGFPIKTWVKGTGHDGAFTMLLVLAEKTSGSPTS